GKGMSLRDIRRVGDMAEVGRRQIFCLRRAFTSRVAVGNALTIAAAALDVIGPPEGASRNCTVFATMCGCLALRGDAGKGPYLAHSGTEPIGVEDFVEPFPIG